MRRLAPASLLLVLLLAGCDLIERPPLADDFGDPYDLLIGAPATNDGNRSTPYIDDDGALVLAVAYTGGCHEHHFSLRSTVRDGVAQLWLVHQDFDDRCDARVVEVLTLPLSPNVLAQPTVELLRPSGQTLPLRTREDQ